MCNKLTYRTDGSATTYTKDINDKKKVVNTQKVSHNLFDDWDNVPDEIVQPIQPVKTGSSQQVQVAQSGGYGDAPQVKPNSRFTYGDSTPQQTQTKVEEKPKV